MLTVTDVSSNGTFLNDVLIGRGNTQLIHDGDKLSIASSCHYICRYLSQTPNSFFNDYVLSDTLLGSGHYAQVKQCTNRATGELCAVKIFHPTANATATKNKSLDRELAILTDLNHPNIIGYYASYQEQITPTSQSTYLVLEQVTGGELFTRIVSKGKLAQQETRSIINQLITGLSYLHERGIVHRDLKPENILLSITKGPQQEPWGPNEANVEVKIADFGLAKFLGEVQFTNTLCGTPAYVAPEVLANQLERKYNKACDMWSVGVLMYVCLCGFPPFSDDLGPPSMREQILNGKYAFYSPYWDDIGDIVLDLISRLLVVDPVQRLNVSEMMSHPWLTGQDQ